MPANATIVATALHSAAPRKQNGGRARDFLEAVFDGFIKR
jgi:hypothetical protein